MRILALLLLLFAPAAPARADGTAGEFDYYVLSLSWSPTWCALEGRAEGSPQCAAEADFGWVLHGLWPQYERGWPDYCESDRRAPSRAETAAMADVTGTAGLAFHAWNKHGTCAGLSSRDYYRLSREAFGRVTLPPALELDRAVTLPAGLIEEAFLRDNPSIPADGLTVTCRAGRIQEVRICLTRDLAFRDCAPDTRRDCTLDSALFDPVE